MAELFYFSCGSNSDARRIALRCGPTTSRRRAVAEGMRLSFLKRAELPGIDDAGFATLSPDGDARSTGVVHGASEAQLAAIDPHAGTPEHHLRHPTGLRLADGG